MARTALCAGLALLVGFAPTALADPPPADPAAPATTSAATTSTAPAADPRDVVRLQSIGVMKRVLAQPAATPAQHADILLRLSELEAEQAGTLTGDAAKAWRDQAVAGYTQVRTEHTALPQAAEATFDLANLYVDEGAVDLAMAEFTRLTTGWPDSPFTMDAWVRLGDHAFDAGDYKAAATAYQAATGNRAHPLYTYACYKLGWSLYDQHRVPEAITAMRTAVDATTSPGDAALHAEAVKDLATFQQAPARK